MSLTDHDLRQISREYLASLSPEQLLRLSGKMLDDLRDARDRLNQSPQNSSRPSGSYAPWEQAGFSDKKQESDEVDDTEEKEKQEKEENTTKRGSQSDDVQSETESGGKRKAGKQAGAKGFGRQVEIAVTGEEIHKAWECAACGESLGEETPFLATTGLYVLDLEREERGMQVSHVKHLYGECRCRCGHVTETKPGRCEDEPGWTVALTEWHLVGPTLASLIICLSLRMRLSRPRIREFLHDWLDITLSVGCINQCITEGGRAVAPIEDELVAEIQQSELLHADETGWKESGRTVWLWVLRTATVTLYMIGRRGMQWRPRSSGWRRRPRPQTNRISDSHQQVQPSLLSAYI